MLYTYKSNFARLSKCPSNDLYFVDINKLMSNYMPTFIAQPDDVSLTATTVVTGGSCGQILKSNSMQAHINIIAIPSSNRKKEITHDVSYRVWRLHKRINHASLETLAHMIRENLLGEVDVTYQEVNVVADH